MLKHLRLAAIGVLLCLQPADAAELAGRAVTSASEAAAWRGVGRVNISGMSRRTTCTGTLIRPDLVLTAAHCLINFQTGQQHAVDDVHFVAGWHRGRMSGHRKAIQVILHPEWHTLTQRPKASELGNDLALIRLETPMSEEEAIPFGLDAPPEPNDPILLYSYRSDRQHTLTRQDDCMFRAIVKGVMLLECAVVKGVSGAPVFRIVDGVARVVGVVSARSGKRARAFAARVNKTVDPLMAALQ